MMKKATLALTTAGLLLFTSLTTAYANDAALTYTDLKGHFAQQAVQTLTEYYMLSPGENDAFAPNKNITKVEFNGWIKRVFGVSVAEWKPAEQNQPITRAQAVVLISKAYAATTGQADIGGRVAFTDLGGLTAPEGGAISELYRRGVLKGTGNGQFQPKKNLTRGEAAVMLSRVIETSQKGGQSVPFTRLKESELPETAYTMMMENKQQAGIASVSEGGFRYVLVAAGEMPSPGYGIEVRDVIETPTAYFIKAVEHTPQPGMMYPQVIVYPYEVIRLKDSTKPIYLQTVAQEDTLKLEKGAMVKRMRQFDLNGDGARESVAVVGTIPESGQTDIFRSGYLGVFNQKGELQQSLPLTGDAVNWPALLEAPDVNRDGKLDLVLDSDLRGNGGRGVHQMNVYLQGANGSFSVVPQQDPEWNKKFKTTYDVGTKTWTIRSSDNHTFKAQYVGKEKYDPTQAGANYASPAVDPHYEVNVGATGLETKHWFWTGAHVHGVAILSAKHEVKDGKLVVTSYRLDEIDENWKVAEQ